MIDGYGMESRGVNTFRPPLAVLLAIAISLGALGLGGWWWLQRQSPLQFQAQRLETPVTARFLPRSANLSVVLEIDPAMLPAYGRAVAPAKQRSTTAARLEQLRDGLFASAGLDYVTELADWLGEENALALKAAAAPGQRGKINASGKKQRTRRANSSLWTGT